MPMGPRMSTVLAVAAIWTVALPAFVILFATASGRYLRWRSARFRAARRDEALRDRGRGDARRIASRQKMRAAVCNATPGGTLLRTRRPSA